MRRAYIASIVAVLVASSGVAAAGPIESLNGVLSTYNLFVLGDLGDSAFDRYGSDVEGRTAVGGNAYTGSFTYGSRLDGSVPALSVGGALDHRYGEIRGSTTVGGSARLEGFSVRGDLAIGGAGVLSNGSVAGALGIAGSRSLSGVGVGNAGAPASFMPDFIALETDLRLASLALANAAPTGLVEKRWGDQLFLTGSSDGLNVFDLEALDLSNLSLLRIFADADSTVLINVSGRSVPIDQSFGFDLVGIAANRVLFNFYEADELALTSLKGSVLAPNARASFAQGAIDGSVVVGSLSNGTGFGGEFHAVPFTGVVTPPTKSIVEPSGVAAVGSGLIVLVALHRALARRSAKN